MPSSRSVLGPLLTGICLLTLGAPLLAADPLASCQAALAGDDSDAKRASLRELAASQLPDALVLPVLVAAVDDRQVADDAIQALRRRTGLTPSVYFSQSHYPGYPANDHPDSWRQWLREWQADHALQLELDEVISASRQALEDAQQAERDAEAARRARSARPAPAEAP